jgi:origin recognition complex subunit 4
MQTINRAIHLLETELVSLASVNHQPIVVRLDGLVHTNDALAIRDMGRQIAEGEGQAFKDDEDEEALAEAEVSRSSVYTQPTLLDLTALALHGSFTGVPANDAACSSPRSADRSVAESDYRGHGEL